MTCLNLPFIIVDMVYASAGDACSTMPVPNISFPLKTWLEVDGALKLALIGLLLIVAIISCINLECALRMFACTAIFLVIYSIFNLAWLIVGAVMYWGYLNNQPGCMETPVGSYMYAVLIMGFLGVCGNCCFTYKSKKQELS